MAMWNICAICGRAIPVGELCYGIKNWHGEPTNGDTICSDCLVPENALTLTPPNEWVSVDNKLPKNGVPVLIGNPHWDYPVVANYAGHGVWMDSWKQKMTFTPTHWMLLPAPPDRRPPEGET